MSDSNAMDEKFFPPVVGLVNRNERGFNSWSATGLLIEPGQVNLYDAPSKSPSMSRQPPIWTSIEAAAGKQKSSSPCGSGPALSASFVSSPSGLVQVLKASLPTAAQYSKCPISSENAMLYVCAADVFRVSGVEVLNSGWNA